MFSAHLKIHVSCGKSFPPNLCIYVIYMGENKLDIPNHPGVTQCLYYNMLILPLFHLGVRGV